MVERAFAAFIFAVPCLSAASAQECSDSTVRLEASQLATKSGNWVSKDGAAEYHLSASYDKKIPYEQKNLIEIISWNDACTQSKRREIRFFRDKRLVGVSDEDGVISVFYQ